MGSIENWRPPTFHPSVSRTAKIKKMLVRFLDLQAGSIWRDLSPELPKIKGTVLDVGCGVQPYRNLFSSGIRYIGLDSSDAKSHFGFETPDTIYFKGTTWPVGKKSIDFILCTETLEHIPDPSVFLAEAFRVLKPKGRILLTVPFAARWHFIPFDYWRYTPSSLDILLKKAGFQNIKVYARGNQLTIACYKVMALIFFLINPVNTGFIQKNIYRFVGLLSFPVLILSAILANLTIAKDGSVDCLGYTVWAESPITKPQKTRNK